MENASTTKLTTKAILTCSRIGNHGPARFNRTHSSYPLKIVCPRSFAADALLAYLITYGGGLVGGDAVSLQITAGKGCVLLLLTQGSTKVYKRRSEMPLAHWFGSNQVSRQNLNVTIEENATLLLIPDPVTLFTAASYMQTQTFALETSSSLALLDWYTSGRMSRGERWAFERYESRNEIYIDGALVVRDVMFLENDYAKRLEPYDCYATLFLVGSAFEKMTSDILTLFDGVVIRNRQPQEDIIWSASKITNGCVVRLAGITTEVVKDFIKHKILGSEANQGLASVIGNDLAARTLI